MRPMEEWTRTADVADTISRLLLEHPFRPPSHRQIAAAMRFSPGTLTYEFGGVDEMLRKAAGQVARDHARSWMWRGGLGGEDLRDLLPASPEDLHDERIWRRWRALALNRPEVAAALEPGRAAELAKVGDCCRGAEELVEPLHVLVTGIAGRLVEQPDPWSTDRARATLSTLTGLVGLPERRRTA